MNLKRSESSFPITFDEESSTSHPVAGESLTMIFPYVLISMVDTNPIVLSYLSVSISSYVSPSFTYPISSTSRPSVPFTSRVSTSPPSSFLSGFGTTFYFGMGSSLVIGSRVPSTTISTTSTITSHPITFSLWITPIFHNVPSSS